MWEDYTIGEASYFDISIVFRLNFVTVVDLCGTAGEVHPWVK